MASSSALLASSSSLLAASEGGGGAMNLAKKEEAPLPPPLPLLLLSTRSWLPAIFVHLCRLSRGRSLWTSSLLYPPGRKDIDKYMGLLLRGNLFHFDFPAEREREEKGGGWVGGGESKK